MNNIMHHFNADHKYYLDTSLKLFLRYTWQCRRDDLLGLGSVAD